MAWRFNRVFPLLALLALAGCAHTTNETQSLCGDGASPCDYRPDLGYRFLPDKDGDRSTLVVVTFSGGGVRAAALAYGTLLALQDLPGPVGDGAAMLDKVDVISSVSGGSVTAGWYALKGKAGLAAADGENPLLNFLYNGGQSAIAWRALNPVSLARYGLTDYQRSDVLAGFFADRLFGKATYAEVERRYRTRHDQPFVVLNATDLGHETRFPFTQGRFDLICSDLAQYPLAYGVTASANFPVVFSPIGLDNHSADCERLHQSAAWRDAGPARWIADYGCYESADAGGAVARSPYTNGLLELRAAREARGYIDPAPGDRILHLVDGGLVDNLGVLSTLAIEDDPAHSPGLYQRLSPAPKRAAADGCAAPSPIRRPARYDNIKKVLYIVVNARARTPAGIDGSVYPPGVVGTTSRVIDTPLDSTILDTQDYLTAELEAVLGAGATQCRRASRSNAASAAVPAERCFKIVAIDFEMIPNQACRDAFWQFDTSWTLDRPVIEKLIALPRVILARSRDLAGFYDDEPRQQEEFKAWATTRDFAKLCADLPPPGP
jgi:NTE family protein